MIPKPSHIIDKVVTVGFVDLLKMFLMVLCSEIQVKNMLAKEITTALRQGKHTFISGMARGSDIYAAELVLEYRAQYPDIHLICALPHPDFEKHWSSEWQQRYRKILMAADYVKVICPVFSMSSYQLRNEWMVNHSSLLIAVYNGRAGGTRNTIEYANKCHVEVHML